MTSIGEAPAMELRGMSNTHSLRLLPGSFFLLEVVPVWSLSEIISIK